MTTDQHDHEHEHDGEQEDALESDGTTRRDALKKAAVAAAAAGATFFAPRVEGLSLVPDIAAAGTVPSGTTVVSNWNAVPGPFTTDWMTPGGNAQSKNYPTPGGTVTVTINGNQADSGANIPVTLTFPGFDPPFNRLCGGNFNFRGRNSNFNSRNGPHPGGPLAPRGLPAGPTPVTPSTSLGFTIPSGVNDVGPFPSGNTQWGDLTFTFTFC